MEQYIPKSAVLAEIRKYKNNAEAYLKYHHNRNDKSVYAFEQEKLAMCELLSSLDTLEVQEEPVSEDLEKAAVEAFKQIVDSDKNNFLEIFKAGANWKKEQIEEVLLSEVLPCFMHGGEADEVVAKLDEVLNKKK